MRLPGLNTQIMSSLPIFIGVGIAAAAIYHWNLTDETIPLVLGIIAGGLVDLDNRLTGRLKNLLLTLAAFAVSSLAVQFTIASPWLFVFTLTAMSFLFTLFGAVSQRYRTIAFGTLAVAVYTTLAYRPHHIWYINPLMILTGTVLYSGLSIILHIAFPHRAVQDNVATAYSALAKYLDAKAGFFDPDDVEHIEEKQIDLAMKNSAVIAAFNQCRSALFYRMRGQHRHPRTNRMLRYYFLAQDIHERVSSSHIDYRREAERLKNTDLIFRFQRLLELQAQACRVLAASLRENRPYEFDERLKRAGKGLAQSAAHFSGSRSSEDTLPLQRLAANLRTVNYQLSHLDSGLENPANDDSTRIAHQEYSSLKDIVRSIRGQLTLQSSVFRHAVRIAVITFVCGMLVQAFQLKLGYWILLTAVFVCQPNYSATQTRLRQRITGTLAGVLVGTTLPYFVPALAPKLLVLVVSTTLFFIFRTNKYSHSTFFITIQALTSFSIAGLDLVSALPLRMVDTVLGSALAWLAVSYLWPDWHYLALDKTGVQAVRSDAGYLKSILRQLQNGSIDDVDYRSARRLSHERAAALASTVSDISTEPARYGGKIQIGFDILKINYSLLGYISALGAYRSQMQRNDADAFLNAYFQAAYRTADLLEQLPQYRENTFRREWEALSHTVAGFKPNTADAGEQNYILWQQLDMIVRVLPDAYAAVHGLSATSQ